MAKADHSRPIRNALDRWAQDRFLKILDGFDPLTARRLRFALKEGLTLDELIEREDRGLRDLAEHLVNEGQKRVDQSAEE